MVDVKELENLSLELRSYDITISSQNEIVNTPGLRTDPEHNNIWGAFIHDEKFSGEPASLDIRSRISLTINQIQLWDNLHAALFMSNITRAIHDTSWKFKIPVNRSAIEIEYKDKGFFDVADFPRTVTLYLVCEKKK